MRLRLRLADKFLWIGLAACASILLLAVTSHLTQNVAPIPLLWVVPLSLYLLSFILCFESDRLVSAVVVFAAAGGGAGRVHLGDHALRRERADQAVDRSAVRGVVCVLHGVSWRVVAEAAASAVSDAVLFDGVGGRSGGRVVRGLRFAAVVPRLFGIAGGDGGVRGAGYLGVVAAGVWMRAGLVLATVGFAGYLGYTAVKKDRLYVRSVRNFYGVMHVRDDEADSYGVPAERVLVHGTIDHGTQLKEDTKGRITTSYFGYTSGINRAIRGLRKERGALRLGILGLGAGVTATLANAGDTLHYYEINSLVPDVASHQFGFLKGCPARGADFDGRCAAGAGADSQREPGFSGDGRVFERCRAHAFADARGVSDCIRGI